MLIGREFNHEQCLSHDFLSGYGPVEYSYASFLVSPKPSCHHAIILRYIYIII